MTRGGLRIYEDFERCVRIKSNKERCMNKRLPGVAVCNFHKGGLPSVRDKVERTKAASALITGMSKFSVPVPAGEANPIRAFEMEFRKTLGRIKYLEDKISELSEGDLIWGDTKFEDKEVTGYSEKGEASYVLKTQEARVSLYYAMLNIERRFLLDMQKIWIGANLDAKKLEVEKRQVDLLSLALGDILSGLGHNPGDPEVRRVVRGALQRLPREAAAAEEAM